MSATKVNISQEAPGEVWLYPPSRIMRTNRVFMMTCHTAAKAIVKKPATVYVGRAY